LDSVKRRLTCLSEEQIGKLKQINEQTISLLNPLPKNIFVFFVIDFKIDNERAKKLDQALKGVRQAGDSTYCVADTILNEACDAFFDKPFDYIKITFMSGNKSVSYDGVLTNYCFHDDYDFGSRPFNDHSVQFTNVLYFQKTRICQFTALVELEFYELSGPVQNINDFASCSIALHTEFVELYKKKSAKGTATFVCGFKNKYQFGKRDIPYKKDVEGYQITLPNIFTQGWPL
jgi:hypothetical protein